MAMRGSSGYVIGVLAMTAIVAVSLYFSGAESALWRVWVAVGIGAAALFLRGAMMGGWRTAAQHGRLTKVMLRTLSKPQQNGGMLLRTGCFPKRQHTALPTQGRHRPKIPLMPCGQP